VDAMARSKNKKTNPNLIQLIKELKRFSYENDAPIWKDIAKRLENPSSKWAEVNVGKIERIAKENEMIIVPGKMLGTGIINKPVTVAAFRFSKDAEKKIQDAGGNVLSIIEIIDKNPKGTNIRIMG